MATHLQTRIILRSKNTTGTIEEWLPEAVEEDHPPSSARLLEAEEDMVGKVEDILMAPLWVEVGDHRVQRELPPLTQAVSIRLGKYFSVEIIDVLTANGINRKPLKTPPLSPDVPAWDNPFPTFPGAKKKTSVSEEQAILEKMAAMEVGGPPQSRARGGKGGQGYGSRNVPTDDYGRPSIEGRRPPPDDYGRRSAESSRRPPPDTYGRQSSDSQRPMPPRNYPPQQQGPPQQGYQEPRRGPQGGYQQQPQNAYSEPGYDDRGSYGSRNGPASPGFGPPGRSMTMGNEQQMPPMGRQPPIPAPIDGPGPSAPYNGPVGRQAAPRPGTAGGQRPPPQRNYGQQAPMTQDPYGGGREQPPPVNTYQDNQHFAPQDYSAQSNDAPYDDFFDAYYDSPGGSAPPPHDGRRASAESEMPNFDAVPTRPGNHKRGASIDEHIQPQTGGPPNGYTPQLKPIKSQPDFRGRAEPQTAVFEMAGAPPMPNAPIPQAFNAGYGPQGGYGGPQNGQYNQDLDPAYQQQYSEPPPQQNSFVPPPRSASAAPTAGQAGYAGGLPSGPRPGVGGLPNGPAPQKGTARANTMNSVPPRQSPLSPDALPSHPPPVRAGLIPNSVASLASNKPTPIRNYSGMNSPPQQIIPQQPPPQQQAQQQPMNSMPTAPAPASAARPLSTAPVTAAELEQLRQVVKGNPNDQASALLLARKLVEASETLVQTISDQRTRNKTREKYVMDAHKILKRLVQSQNTDAMFFLADSHGKGALGLEPDNKEAFTLYQSAAKAGHAAAAYRTAVCCELGNDEGGGTRKDPLKAIQWYKRAAMLGDTPAMYKMGMILLKGLLGQPKNPREAVGWLKRAAERADAENPHALHELGLLFEMPQSPESSVVRDEAYSFSLFQQAANLGYKYSQYRLGCAYEYGLFGCPVDPRQSIMWYSRAAAQEEHQSELSLSGWYLTGMEGVLQQSDTEAYLWARKAAMAGLAKAEYAMGYFTEVGIGSPANLEDAKRWYWRAAGMCFL
jgi:TPR repeat protein